MHLDLNGTIRKILNLIIAYYEHIISTHPNGLYIRITTKNIRVLRRFQVHFMDKRILQYNILY